MRFHCLLRWGANTLVGLLLGLLAVSLRPAPTAPQTAPPAPAGPVVIQVAAEDGVAQQTYTIDAPAIRVRGSAMWTVLFGGLVALVVLASALAWGVGRRAGRG